MKYHKLRTYNDN